MSDRELDARVAEKVMGWTMKPVSPHVAFDTVGTPPGGGAVRCCDRYTSDANADYQVLRHVRETWDEERLDDFRIALWDTWRIRSGLGETEHWELVDLYIKGDYARAALAVVEESK